MKKRKNNRRQLDGILLLDKPTGPTSNAVLQTLKSLYFAAKAGHTGSLDPLASGMLPICFGEATKFSQYLLAADKTYFVRAKLGVRTTTSDAEGEVVSTRDVPILTLKKIDQACNRFRGDIEQVPSMYSALKFEGKPLYKYAREGITVPREPRKIYVDDLTVLDYKNDVITFTLSCTSGTYVRTIVDDLGEDLGCGAHVIELRRTRVGHYQEQDMITLDTLEEMRSQKQFAELDGLLLPIDEAVGGWPAIYVSEALAFYLNQGSPVQVPNLPEGKWMRLYSQNEKFLGIGEVIDDGRVAPRRLLAL